MLSELREDPRLKIVEGKKDAKALEYFGITNSYQLNRRSLSEVAEDIDKEAIILTDYDRTGSVLAKKLREVLTQESVNVDVEYRKKLREACGLTKIEELVGKYEKLKGDFHGKDLHRHRKIHGICECGNRRHG